MPDYPQLIQMLHSSSADRRFEACEKLRLSSSIPEDAIRALQDISKDPNRMVAKAARHALAAHGILPADKTDDPLLKPYVDQKHISPQGILILLFGGILAGVIIGSLAYLISNLIYFIILFTIVMALAGMAAYTKVVEYSKVNHFVITTIFGLITGIIIVYTYYGLSYFVIWNDSVSKLQQSQQVDFPTAALRFNEALKGETGYGGLLGFMALRARYGDDYTQYLIFNQIPIQLFNFTVKSTWAWLYWLLETLIIIIMVGMTGYQQGKRPFNIGASDWYDSHPKTIGTVTLSNKDNLSDLLKSGDLQGLSMLIAPEGDLPHPLLEINEYRSKNNRGGFLLTVQQTRRVSPTRVKRQTIQRWEISRAGYRILSDMLKRRQVEPNLQVGKSSMSES